MTGWFNANLRRDGNWNFFRVTDEQGARVDVGEPQLSSDRRQMTVDLQPNLQPGRYLVTWRTWDDEDGRIFGDCFVFFVGQEAADASVAANYRLDGGADCERIDYQADMGTPVPELALTPTSGGHSAPGGTADSGSEGESHDESNGGVASWLLVVTGGLGLVVGLIGGRFMVAKGS